MLYVRLAGDHLYGKVLFTWLSLVMSLIVSFYALLFPTRWLGWDLGLNWVSFWRLSYLLLRLLGITFKRQAFTEKGPWQRLHAWIGRCTTLSGWSWSSASSDHGLHYLHYIFCIIYRNFCNKSIDLQLAIDSAPPPAHVYVSYTTKTYTYRLKNRKYALLPTFKFAP